MHVFVVWIVRVNRELGFVFCELISSMTIHRLCLVAFWAQAKILGLELRIALDAPRGIRHVIVFFVLT